MKLGDAIVLQRGFDLTQATASPGPYPVISSGGIAYWTSVAKVRGPGVVTGRKGVLGKVHFSRAAFWPHDTTLWVKDFKGAYPRYLYYLLQTLPLASLDAGASNPTLNRNHAHLLPIRLPEVSLQQQIAGVLGALDDLIENNRRRVELLEQMAQAIYREWFVHFRYPGHEDAALVDSPLGPIPEGWRTIRLDEIATVNKASRKPASGKRLRYLDISCLGDRSIGLPPAMDGSDAPGRARRAVRSGDIVWSMVRPSRRASCSARATRCRLDRLDRPRRHHP